MRRSLALCTLAALTARCLAGPPSELKTAVEKHLEPLFKAGKFAQVVGILIGGQEHIFAYGNLTADSRQPVDGDTIFEIGSLTKTFTALALADMVQHKLVKYDDAVQQFLAPNCRIPTRGGRQITLEHLATHTSGLPRLPPELVFYAIANDDPYARYTPALMCLFLSKHELLLDIGAQWQYSNLGMGLLGYALARRADCSYERLIVDRICKPLGMRDTCIRLSDEQQRRLAHGYAADGKSAAYWHIDALAGCGALLASAKDLLRYAAAQIGTLKTPLDAAVQDSHRPRVLKTAIPEHAQALGWLAIMNTEGQARAHWHNGETGGFHSFVGFMKERRVAVVLLSNRAAQDATLAGLELLLELGEEQRAVSPASSRSAD